VLARPDVPVFPLAAVGHLGLLHPFRGVVDSLRDAESLLDADRDAVRRACPDIVDVIPEGRLGLPVRMDEAVGKLAVRELRLADVVRAHPDSALAVFPGLPAWVALVERWARRRAAAELYIPDEAPSAA
jgi:hypothetical protein